MSAEFVWALIAVAGFAVLYGLVKLAEADQRIDTIIAAALAERGDDDE